MPNTFSRSIEIVRNLSATLDSFDGSALIGNATLELPPDGDTDLGAVKFIDPESGSQFFRLKSADVTVESIEIADEDIVADCTASDVDGIITFEITAGADTGSTTITIETTAGEITVSVDTVFEDLTYDLTDPLPEFWEGIDNELLVTEGINAACDLEDAIRYRLLTVGNAEGSISVNMLSGALPAGLTLETNGSDVNIAGAPDAATAGQYTFEFEIEDAVGKTITVEIEDLTVWEPLVLVAADPLPEFIVDENVAAPGDAITETFELQTEYTGRMTFNGSYPSGMSDDFAGVFPNVTLNLNGTPDTLGTELFSIAIASLQGGGTEPASGDGAVGVLTGLSINVVEPVDPFVPVVQVAPFYENLLINQEFLTLNGFEGSDISRAPSGSVALPALAAVTGGALPAGCTAEVWDDGGDAVVRIIGTPTEDGTFGGTITVTDDDENEFEVPFTVIVYTQAAATLVDPFPSFQVGVAESEEPLTEAITDIPFADALCQVIQDDGSCSDDFIEGSSGMVCLPVDDSGDTILTADGTPQMGQNGTFNITAVVFDTSVTPGTLPFANGKLAAVDMEIVIAPA